MDRHPPIGNFTCRPAGKTCRGQFVRPHYKSYQIVGFRVQQQCAVITGHRPAVWYLHPVTAFANGHFIRVLEKASPVLSPLSLETRSRMVQDSVQKNAKVSATERP